ncbi:MAG: hypothetical protein D6761_04820 [Candidatus Dadabacteria bacterium]|nr:MAG: hypothetical protein D6761_04820 [Candidatus Dadabacteria bacterium]
MRAQGQRVAIASLTLLLLATGVFGGFGSGPQHAEAAISEQRLQRLNFFYRFQLGRNYFNSGSYLEAAAHFHSLLGQYASLPRPLQLQLDYYLGISYHEAGLSDRARPHLKKVIATAFIPQFVVDAAVAQMAIDAARGHADEVQKTYDRIAARNFPPDLRVQLDYGAIQARYRLKDYRGVRDLALRLPPGTPEYPRGILLSALSMMATKQYSAAEEDLMRLLNAPAELESAGIDNQIPRLQLMLAQVRFDRGDYRRCLQTLDQIQAPELAADVLYTRGWAQLMQQRYDTGLETFERLVRDHPEDERSVEATLLGGYTLLNLARFPEAYAYFATLETEYRKAARELSRFRGGFNSIRSLDQLLQSNARLAKAPIPPQIRDWIYQSRDVRLATGARDEVAALGRLIGDLLRDLKRMRVVSAGFGSSFENPATLERLLRNESALRLTEIRSRILELMIKPVREGLLASQTGEYNLINQAQSTRKEAIKAIRTVANPVKERATAIQRSLRKIQHYLYLVADKELSGTPDPASRDISATVELSRPALDILDQLMTDEERIAFVLLKVMEEEERLWSVIAETISIERGAAERILRKLGLWDSQAYIDRLELLYRSTSGIESILNDNGELLLAIQTGILDGVMRYTDTMNEDLADLRQQQGALFAAAEQVRLQRVDVAWDGEVQRLREAEARMAGGKLDLGWRIKEVEHELMNDVLREEQDRLRELNAYYDKVRDQAEAAARAIDVLDERIRSQIAGSVQGDRTVDLSKSLEMISRELEQMERFVNELSRGSKSILERDKELQWVPEYQR